MDSKKDRQITLGRRFRIEKTRVLLAHVNLKMAKKYLLCSTYNFK